MIADKVYSLLCTMSIVDIDKWRVYKDNTLPVAGDRSAKLLPPRADNYERADSESAKTRTLRPTGCQLDESLVQSATINSVRSMVVYIVIK